MFDEIADWYDQLLHTGEIYDITQQIKTAVSLLAQTENIIKSIDSNSKVTLSGEMLATEEFIQNLHKRMNSYYKDNIMNHLSTRQETTDKADKICAVVKNEWIPKVKELIKAKSWEGAAKALVNIPYQYDQFWNKISDREITDKKTIKNLKELDNFMIKTAQKIPAKSLNQVVDEIFQKAMEKKRTAAQKALNDLAAIITSKEAFTVKNPPFYNFGGKEISAVKQCFEEARGIAGTATTIKDLREIKPKALSW